MRILLIAAVALSLFGGVALAQLFIPPFPPPVVSGPVLASCAATITSSVSGTDVLTATVTALNSLTCQ
jgi:hypothetical protein